MVDYPRIRAFLEVADCLNFTQAAERLYMSQSALSKTVAHLESEFGFPLFVRTNRSVTLTREGALLRDRLRDSVGAIESAIIEAKRMKLGRAGSCSIAFENLSILSAALLSRCNEFRRAQPRFALQPVQCAAGTARQKLIYDEVDAIVAPIYAIGQVHEVQMQRIDSLQPAFFCRADHPALRAPADASLRHYGFLCLDPSVSPEAASRLQAVCGRLGFTPEIVGYAASIEELAARAALSDELVLLPGFAAAACAGAGACLALPDEAPVEIVLAWKQRNDNPALAQCLAFLAHDSNPASPPS